MITFAKDALHSLSRFDSFRLLLRTTILFDLDTLPLRVDRADEDHSEKRSVNPPWNVFRRTILTRIFSRLVFGCTNADFSQTNLSTLA